MAAELLAVIAGDDDRGLVGQPELVHVGEQVGQEKYLFVRRIVFRPDGEQVAVLMYGRGLLLRDLQTGEEIRRPVPVFEQGHVSYSADSSRLLLTYERGGSTAGFAVVLVLMAGLRTSTIATVAIPSIMLMAIGMMRLWDIELVFN